jgi:two-component system chemotaxis response regulator CheB
MPRTSATNGRTRSRVRPAIRLLIVDDSLVARTALKRMVEGAAELEVIAVASTAARALEVLARNRVDVILLDLEMPGISGLEALPRIIASAQGARILVVSSLTLAGAEHTLAALSLGATDTLPKPQARGFHDGYAEVLVGKIRALGRVAGDVLEMSPPPSQKAAAPRLSAGKPPAVLAIGASTGGVHALATLFGALRGSLGVPILVTQHLPPAFMPHFARQLSTASGYPTLLAVEGAAVEPDKILIAPGDAHLAFSRQAGRLIVRLEHDRASSGCMPSVDRMLGSLAEEVGDRVLGVVLTGMGRDGVEGAAQVVAAGGTILAQDEASSAVWGMPRAIAEAGLASALLPPAELADLIDASLGLTTCR